MDEMDAAKKLIEQARGINPDTHIQVDESRSTDGMIRFSFYADGGFRGSEIAVTDVNSERAVRRAIGETDDSERHPVMQAWIDADNANGEPPLKYPADVLEFAVQHYVDTGEMLTYADARSRMLEKSSGETDDTRKIVNVPGYEFAKREPLDLSKLTKKELLALAEGMHVEIASGASKADILAILSDVQAAQNETPTPLVFANSDTLARPLTEDEQAALRKARLDNADTFEENAD